MSETTEEQLKRLRQELNIDAETENTSEVNPEEGLTMSDRARLTATGLLFNYADEAVAALKSLSPNMTYEDALSYEREQLKSAQEKPGSLKYEIGGALIPALAAAPFTGGTSVAPTALRLAAIGAGQGLVAGTGASEEEGLARLKDAPLATITGAIANPLFAKLTQASQAAITPLFDSIRRAATGKVAKKVEDEILRIITDSGITVDDFLNRVRNGQILPEMSEEAAENVSAFATKAGPASPIIREEVYGRKNQFVREVYENLIEDLSPNNLGDNIYETFANNADDLLKAESKAYDALWTGAQTYKAIDDAVLSLGNSSKNSRGRIVKYFDDAGFPSPFKMVGKGKNAKIELSRSLTLFEGELIKRAFMDAKNAAQKSGAKNKAFQMSVFEDRIKNVVDEISPELKATRKNWAIINDAVKHYEIGEKAFNQNPEEFAVLFARLVRQGKTEAINALRSGAASALKGKSQSGSKVGTVSKLSDKPDEINLKEREILEILYPDEKIDDIVAQINQARGSIMASQKTYGGSQTGSRVGRAERVGLGQGLADFSRVVLSNGMDIGAVGSIVKRFFGGKSPEFTDEQFKKIGRLIVSNDADLLERNLTDQARIDALYNVIGKAVNTVTGSSQARVETAVSATEGAGDMFNLSISSSVSPALDALIQTINPDAAAQVQEAAQ
tara:strand:+ start:1418 stop:3442 length:2025 start_codon:yes stop_codon:yes gene_type:complete